MKTILNKLECRGHKAKFIVLRKFRFGFWVKGDRPLLRIQNVEKYFHIDLWRFSFGFKKSQHAG